MCTVVKKSTLVECRSFREREDKGAVYGCTKSEENPARIVGGLQGAIKGQSG